MNVRYKTDIAENLAKYQAKGRLSSSDSEEIIRRLDRLDNEGVTISDKTLETLAKSDAGNLRSTNYELAVATKYLDRGENVVKVGDDIAGSEVDVLIQKSDGDVKVVEAKDYDWERNSAEDIMDLKNNLGNKFDAYEREYGSSTEIVIEFSDKNNIPEEITNYIQRKKNEGYNVKMAQ